MQAMESSCTGQKDVWLGDAGREPVLGPNPISSASPLEHGLPGMQWAILSVMMVHSMAGSHLIV